jgi:hypothetical protein
VDKRAGLSSSQPIFSVRLIALCKKMLAIFLRNFKTSGGIANGLDGMASWAPTGVLGGWPDKRARAFLSPPTLRPLDGPVNQTPRLYSSDAPNGVHRILFGHLTTRRDCVIARTGFGLSPASGNQPVGNGA